MFISFRQLNKQESHESQALSQRLQEARRRTERRHLIAWSRREVVVLCYLLAFESRGGNERRQEALSAGGRYVQAVGRVNEAVSHPQGSGDERRNALNVLFSTFVEKLSCLDEKFGALLA